MCNEDGMTSVLMAGAVQVCTQLILFRPRHLSSSILLHADTWQHGICAEESVKVRKLPLELPLV